MKSEPTVLKVVGLALAILCAGCRPEGDADVFNELDLARARQKQLTAQVEKLSARQSQQEKQIATLQKLGKVRLGKLFVVDHISLGKYTGGVDLDRKVGQDAVKVFLKPIDQTGSVVKAAGDVKIQLFDLAQPEGQRLLGEFCYPVEQIGKHWAGGFMTQHFSFLCRWKTPPKHPDITVRVEFIDYLTGKTHTAQKFITLALPVK